MLHESVCVCALSMVQSTRVASTCIVLCWLRFCQAPPLPHHAGQRSVSPGRARWQPPPLSGQCSGCPRTVPGPAHSATHPGVQHEVAGLLVGVSLYIPIYVNIKTIKNIYRTVYSLYIRYTHSHTHAYALVCVPSESHDSHPTAHPTTLLVRTGAVFTLCSA